jgi:hypothetical protein
MKNSQFIIFLSVVLTVYSLANAYIFFKGYNVLPPLSKIRFWYTLIFILLALTFIGGKFLEASNSSLLSDLLNVIGGFWMGFMLYAFLTLFASDIIAVLLRITGMAGADFMPLYRKWAFISAVSVSLVMITGGFINAVIPVVKEYNINIEKKADGISSLRIAAVSDIHLGSTIRKRSIKKLSAILSDLKPELVLLLGDIVDGEMGPVQRGDLLKYFYAPETKDGLYAITGNHEYIGGASRTIPYIESKGIRILKDEMVILPGGIQLAGRLDRDSKRYTGRDRLPLDKILSRADHSKPLILMDHQPFNLDESVKNRVDLHLSGHTHNGQMWPLNYLTRKIYEVSYGYLKKDKTNIIVSSGYGLWGPRIRSGSRSEILLINLVFNEQEPGN